MGADVEAVDLLFLADPEADGDGDDLGYDPGRHRRKGSDRDDSDHLDDELVTHGDAFRETEAAQAFDREDRRQKRADDAADTVNREDVEGIVDLEGLLD